MYNLPNLLTISRIMVIPVIFLSLYTSSALFSIFVAILFVAASITDYFDGYLARQRGETSAFGRLLDPIADKLLVASALVVILAKPDMVWTRLSFIPVFVILCREILVSGLREFLREVNVGLPVTRLAKWKTGFQMTALSMMLFNNWWIWNHIGEFLLWIAAVLTFITGYQYFQKSVDYVKSLEAAKTVEAKIVIKKTSAPAKVSSEKKADKKVVSASKGKAPKKAATQNSLKKTSKTAKSNTKKTTASKSSSKKKSGK